MGWTIERVQASRIFLPRPQHVRIRLESDRYDSDEKLLLNALGPDAHKAN